MNRVTQRAATQLSTPIRGRRHFVWRLLASASAFALTGCDAATNSRWGAKVLRAAE